MTIFTYDGPLIYCKNDVSRKGWYMHLQDGLVPTTTFAWYRFDPDDEYKWRTDTGCGDAGPFDENDYFIGPIEMPR